MAGYANEGGVLILDRGDRGGWVPWVLDLLPLWV